jgi:dienelactone hydrolase
MRLALIATAALAAVLAGCTSIRDVGRPPDMQASGPEAGRQPDKNADGSELWLIPSTVPGTMMRASLFLPRGSGPFRLAVVNHGSEQDASRRVSMAAPAFPGMTTWLLSKNYAVLVPQRPGHGATGGRYLEDQGACDSADYVLAGNGAADSIDAAINYMIEQPKIRRTGVLVVGNSAGGWGALALAARNPPAVSGVVTFSAGRGGRNYDRANTNCSPDRLVAAAGVYGRTARIPTLMLYAENDSYFPRALSSEMATAYRQGGADVTYRLTPPVRTGEGHALIDAPESLWSADLAKFIAGLR